ncbi:DUF2939 domain-containing protein [Massilia sp. BSC265]|uniref:DUF2939 domain-containing protein n=1 Tax=Massilia sp. BSC265 TaxID=1549812 RepID=UPI0004E89F4E|nr:DUF2939 domain-containing protein [Massilia sp. BSC265]KFI07679.1 hypothetical protein JN27_08920 [Massilia sp. BSC265]
MKKKTTAIAAGVAIAALAVATWASPHWQLYRMHAAVEARDVQSLSGYVDFPKLRESVKVQVMRRLGADGALAQPRSNPFAAFGRAMALAAIDPVVDAAVSPRGVMAMLEAGDIRVQPKPDGPPPAASDAPREKRNYDLSYRSWKQVVVERAEGGGVAFLLDRHGLWSWKLAGVELREE